MLVDALLAVAVALLSLFSMFRRKEHEHEWVDIPERVGKIRLRVCNSCGSLGATWPQVPGE